MSIIEFNSTKCKHCYKCVRNCDVKAIMIKDERAHIMEDHCILCGHCLMVCPQSAKTLSSQLSKVRGMIASGKRVIASLAPSYIGLLKYDKPGQIKSALMRLGFEDVRETGEGAAFVTAEYEKLISEGRMENIITTCCPSANEMIELYYPELTDYLAPVVSPMIAHGKLIKKELGNDVRVVFIGPCIAKKREAEDIRNEGIVDAVLDFNDINSWLFEEDIDIDGCEDAEFTHFNPGVNRLYPVTGGIVSSVNAGLHRNTEANDGYRKLYVHGSESCIELCRSLKNGDIHKCFIEMNICIGGCINGPASGNKHDSRFKLKLDMEEAIEKIPVSEQIIEEKGRGINFAKAFYDRSIKEPVPDEAKLQEILGLTGKVKPSDELNCGACGYPTCRAKAIAVYQNKAELDMCIPFMHGKAESLSNLVMETSPNVVIMADSEMKIVECSSACEKYFGKSRSEALRMYLYEIIDPVDFQWVYDTHQNIHGKKVSYEEYGIDTLQNIVYIEKEDCVLATIIDISREEREARADYEKKLETIDMAQRVIHKQMMVAQEIAGLLGETTADTKTTLTKLCRTLLDDENGGRQT